MITMGRTIMSWHDVLLLIFLNGLKVLELTNPRPRRTAIGLFLVLTVLLCVTLIMVRGLDGNIDNSLSSSEANIQSNKGNQMNEDREENLSDSLQMENVNEHETSNIVSGDSVHMKKYSLDHFYNQLDYSMDGNEVLMSNFVGNVLVLVNVASE